MSTFLLTTEFFNACAVLFGPEIEVSLDFLKYLRVSGLKAAYRKKALETHPDRAKAMGEDEAEMNERFKRATLAYETLCSVINDNERTILGTKPMREKTNNKTFSKDMTYNDTRDYFFTGYIPRRKLLIGQFLFYSGCISWNTFINAITWQKRQRPAIGRIALDWGMLSTNDIQDILEGRIYKEKFGETAIRRGYLNTFKLMALLGKQRRLQRPIGEYFIQTGDFTLQEMEEMVERQRHHNSSVRLDRWR